MPCLICLEEGVEPLKKCSSPDCASEICDGCLERFLDMAMRERTVPRCLAPGCSALFLRSAFPTPKYELALFRGLLRDPELEDSLKTQDQQRRFRDELVREREMFMEASFPASIRRAVQIMYAPDLKRVHKNNLEAMEKERKPTKRCGRLLCNGFMRLQDNEKWCCATCKTMFCALCELRFEYDDHECREGDVASVSLKKTLGECPECHQIIEKSYGCDNMTCAVCGTHFSYTTGVRTQHGNHGANIPVTLSTGPQTGFTSLWERLLKSRPRHALSTKEERLALELDALEALGLPPDENNEWKSSEISLLMKWAGTEGEKEERRVARTVALRVENLETQRQETRHFWNRLRRVEDEIVSL